MAQRARQGNSFGLADLELMLQKVDVAQFGANWSPSLSKDDSGKSLLLALSAMIVGAHASRNATSPAELKTLLRDVHRTLRDLEARTPAPQISRERSTKPPAVDIDKSVKHNTIVCLEDGLAFRSLKRHLRLSHNMTPEDYRWRWGLPSDHPLVAPGYSARRSAIAKEIGLGVKSKAQKAKLE